MKHKNTAWLFLRRNFKSFYKRHVIPVLLMCVIGDLGTLYFPAKWLLRETPFLITRMNEMVLWPITILPDKSVRICPHILHLLELLWKETKKIIPSFYMNVGHFSEYSGHPNNKFQTFLKNSRVQVGVYLWCTKICIFQSRFCTIFFKIFCSVFPEKFMKNHFHFANLFTGLGFSTCTFLWNRAS